ncbi:MAG: ATP-binding protein [Armatimonadota bacterium]
MCKAISSLHNTVENEQILKSILNTVQIGVIIVDPKKHTIVDANATAVKMIGATEDEIAGHICHKCICPSDVGHCPITDLNQTIDNSERVLLRIDGSKIPVLKTVASTIIDGQPLLVESFVDITELKKAKEALQRAHDELEVRVEERTDELAKTNTALINEISENERLLSSISSALILCDSKGIIRKWNKAAENMLGIEAAVAIGRELLDAGLRFEDTETPREILNAIHAAEPTKLGNVTVICPDERSIALMLTIAPILDEEGNAWEFLVVGSDITEVRSLEMQLLHAQRLESIGQLAAGIAHEVNTPIQYVGDNARFIQDSLGQVLDLLDAQTRALAKAREGTLNNETLDEIDRKADEADIEYLAQEIPKAAQQSLEGVNRVAKIVRALKQFSHPGGAEKSDEDLNGAIESTVAVSRHEWKYVAILETKLDPNLPLVPCMINDLNQVVLNLIVNASHAITDAREARGTEEKGIITVSTLHAGDWAEIRVSDTGTGIPEAIRQRIFEPFFTTKSVGKGTGQGLAMARSIVVNKHNGTISFESKEGEGTTFIIRIPLMRQAA